MMPNVGQFDPAKGGGFRETVRYVMQQESTLTRDQLAAGNDSHAGSNRVALVHTIGIGHNGGPPMDADEIAAAMQDIADRADELKKAAGISTRGRKATTPPQWHCSFRDHEHAPPMTDEQWLEFITAALKSLDLPEGHQVLIVKHIEPQRPHWPDWHVVVNKVSSIDGTRWNPMNDQQKLQAFCDDHDKARGLNFTPDRREKMDRVRDWAAKEPDPKKRDRTPPPKKERAAKPSYALRAVIRAAAVEGLAIDDQVREEIAALAPNHAAQWKDYNASKNTAALVAKGFKDASFEQSKAEQKTARGRAENAAYRGIIGWTKRMMIDHRNAQDWTRYKAAKKTRWRLFFQREKSAAGVAVNTAKLLLECRRRGLGGMTAAALLTSPDARRHTMQQIDTHERRRIFDDQRKRKEPINRAADRLMKQARAAHKARCKEIDRRTFTRSREQRQEIIEQQHGDTAAIIERLKTRAQERTAALPAQPTAARSVKDITGIEPFDHLPEDRMTDDQRDASREADWRRGNGEKITAEEVLAETLAARSRAKQEFSAFRDVAADKGRDKGRERDRGDKSR